MLLYKKYFLTYIIFISCPVSTLTSAHGSYTVDKLAISQDAKYLVTVGNEPKPLIKLWLWTLGKDEADGKYVICI